MGDSLFYTAFGVVASLVASVKDIEDRRYRVMVLSNPEQLKHIRMLIEQAVSYYRGQYSCRPEKYPGDVCIYDWFIELLAKRSYSDNELNDVLYGAVLKLIDNEIAHADISRLF